MTRKYTRKSEDDGRSLTDLLKQVSFPTFVRMVMKAGLPVADARALCKAFKELS